MIGLMRLLRANKHKITTQQFKTIKGQALSGDLDGAKKGLDKLLKEKRVMI